MADIPSISITNEFSDNDDDKTDNQIDLVNTDCENLDSDEDSSRVPTGNTLVAPIKKAPKSKKEMLTDCEDFDASDCEDIQIINVETDSITLEEFLDQGCVNETTRYNGQNESSYDGPRQPKRCHSPMLKNCLDVDMGDTGALTDYEDMDGSGDDDEAKEDESEMEMPLLMDENNTVESHDNVRSALGHHHMTTTDSSTSSESSGDEHTPFKSKRKLMGLSDTENMVLSDYETCLKKVPKKPIVTDLAEDEVLIVELSDGDEPGTSEMEASRCIDVHFRSNAKDLHKPGTPQFSKLLAVLQDPLEGLTDVENLNSSDDDDDDNGPGGLTIPAAVVRTDNAYLTDMEDVDGDGVESEGDDEGVEVDCNIVLPKPVRQLIMVQETNTGAPVSRVLPLADNLSLAADVGYQDKGLTDTEDLSDVNEDMYDISSYLIDSVPDMEAGNTTSSDKVAGSSQLGVPSSSADPVTDTEEMTDVGESRKKRHRHRHSHRHKQRLAVNNDEDEGLTDVEELIISEQGNRRHTYNSGSMTSAAPMLTINNTDDGGHTDVELLSGDDEMVPMRSSRRMQRNSSPNILNKSDWFNSAEATQESVHEPGKRCKSNSLVANLPRIRKLSPTPDAGFTDTEEIERSGDDEDEDEQMRGVTPAAVHRQMDENNSTTLDRNVNVFDVDMERLNIKGHQDIPEALTDSEYLEAEAEELRE